MRGCQTNLFGFCDVWGGFKDVLIHVDMLHLVSHPLKSRYCTLSSHSMYTTLTSEKSLLSV